MTFLECYYFYYALAKMRNWSYAGVEYQCVEYKQAFNIKVQLQSIQIVNSCLVYPSTCRHVNPSTNPPLYLLPHTSPVLLDHTCQAAYPSIICPLSTSHVPSTRRVHQSSCQHHLSRCVDQSTPISAHLSKSPVPSDRTGQQVFSLY